MKKRYLSSYFSLISAVLAFVVTLLVLYYATNSFSHNKNYSSFINFHDVQNTSKYYGKPLITIGVIPFDVNTQTILQQFQVSIGSWLRGTAQVVVYVYDIVTGMGNLAPQLLESLQEEFGKDRIFIKGKIIKELKIETIPEAFERVELDSETVFCAFCSNDIILRPDWIDYVYAARKFFGPYNNWSLHVPRRDLFESCRKDVTLKEIASENYPSFLEEFAKRCRSRLHSVGYDVYFWNHLGINMTKANLPKYYIGRPNFDSGIIQKQMDQGWFVTTYPIHESYHLEHPDRIQYAKRMSHPDSVYNTELERKNGFKPFRNSHFKLQMTKNEMILLVDDKWVKFPVNRSYNIFPFSMNNGAPVI
ncbi:hypothetical protein TRFO_12351 [Tritrichomonas foetus]|uniref:Uncharacterized protein n=1 Tax=Tritrichomonas foetus TaxID=1144522 RepID=A0A1J4L1J8_9EUKA|nr:hypothetical protein TRFO_12351 [Tritrichomonas foetus]|eukprot:OHT17399.1 hypothetical protein TRFO_12351 [Tritrichomonas foetus]